MRQNGPEKGYFGWLFLDSRGMPAISPGSLRGVFPALLFLRGALGNLPGLARIRGDLSRKVLWILSLVAAGPLIND